MRKNLLLYSTIFLTTLSISCENKSEYDLLFEQETSREIRNDSLFLGYEFGMETGEFFEYSWDLNKKEIVTGQTNIHYQLDDLKSPATMSFYPDFKNNKIFRMPVEIYYDGWAPWNRNLFADSLSVDLVELYEDIYGCKFIKTVHPRKGLEAWISINGNREIAVYEKDDRIVNVEFTDLSVLPDPD